MRFEGKLKDVSPKVLGETLKAYGEQMKIHNILLSAKGSSDGGFEVEIETYEYNYPYVLMLEIYRYMIDKSIEEYEETVVKEVE